VSGRQLRFAVQVAGGPLAEGLTPQGSVTLSIDGGAPTTAVLVNGQATVTVPAVPPLAPGAHTVTVSYGGDVNFLAGSVSLTETVAGIVDVSGRVTVTRVLPQGAKHHRARVNPLVQTLRVTNVSGADIQGPLYLVLDGLTGGVKLLNATGVSQTHVTPGDPLVLLTMGPLPAGQSSDVTLSFGPASHKHPVKMVAFTPFVLAGPGTV
jgi:hypothetical protein